jgi:hypothetical protein
MLVSKSDVCRVGSGRGNEPSVSIKDRQFLDWLSVALLLRKDSATWRYLLCSELAGVTSVCQHSDTPQHQCRI